MYFKQSKVINFVQVRERYGHINKYCSNCSEHSSTVNPGGRFVKHIHNSSKKYRMSTPEDIWGNYPCTTCSKTHHSFKIGIGYPIILSSSILNLWQGRRSLNLYHGDDLHVTIPGATSKTLHHALLAKYSNTYWPLDVLLVAGLNDVLSNRSVDEIMTDICNMKT